MNINEQLTMVSEKNPNKIAFIFEDKETTYKELEEMVLKFAVSLQELGYKKGDRLALVLWNSPSYIIAFYAALRIGVVVIPINPLYTPREMNFILKDGEVKGIVMMDVFIQQFDKIESDLPNVEHYFLCDSGENIAYGNTILNSKAHIFHHCIEQDHHDYPMVSWNKKDTAMMIYTSGTTGNPKGAMLSFDNIYENAFNNTKHLEFQESDRVIAVLPMVHAFGLGVGLCGPLLRGATLLILPKFSPKEVLRVAKKYKATVFPGVPTMYSYLFQAVTQYQDYIESFKTIRLCISSGASIPIALLNDFERIFRVPIIEGYGLTEAASVAFNPINSSRKPGSIGQSLEKVKMRVVDENDKELPVGVKGELIIQGPSVMKGYYKLPQATLKTIKNGWLYTGDIARVDEDGFFYIVGRKKEMIIVNGYNVYPKEIEELLYTHKAIKEAAVISETSSLSGERIIAYVSLNNPISEEELLHYCKKSLTKYKVPEKVIFLKELPKNPTGKITKKELRQGAK